ncbi:MAG: hypothetical protein WC494_00175 [Candidatus Pacearchaeota archaeon]
MEPLEARAEEHTKGMELRCKGWCHDTQSNHSNEEQQPKYKLETPEAKYFLN